jgi:predicted TIM-barrel fold metal-dependent hydrolase
VDRNNDLTRRHALRVAGTALGAMLLDGTRTSAEEPQKPAAGGGLLKKRFKTRTFNVHTHPLPAAGKPEDQRPDPLSAITAQEKEEAERYFSNGLLTFDSADQLDHYCRKYINHKKAGRGFGSFEANVAHFVKEMDEAGIDTSILLLLDFMRPFTGIADGDPSGERAVKVMAQCAELCQKHPGRLIPYAGIDVRRGKEGTKLLEQAVKEFGFQGCGEIVTTLWRTRPNDKELCYPFYEKCVELGIPVTIDCTMAYGYSDPPLFEEVARDFPRLRLCLGGAGVRVKPLERKGAPSLPAHDAMLKLAEQYENVWLDLDDWQVVDKAGIRVYLDYLRRALNGPARNKIMFGSDYPVFAWMYTEKEWIEIVLDDADRGEFHFTEEELAWFFSKNALRFIDRTDLRRI